MHVKVQPIKKHHIPSQLRLSRKNYTYNATVFYKLYHFVASTASYRLINEQRITNNQKILHIRLKYEQHEKSAR